MQIILSVLEILLVVQIYPAMIWFLSVKRIFEVFLKFLSTLQLQLDVLIILHKNLNFFQFQFQFQSIYYPKVTQSH